MKSLLEIHPNKLLMIVFLLVIFVLPIILWFMDVNFNINHFGLILGLILVTFFLFIYPKISKNNEFLEQETEAKEAATVARRLPGFLKVRIVAGVTLLLLSIVSVYLYFVQKLYYLEFIAPVLAFAYMMYYANFLKQNRQTSGYGEKLAKIVETDPHSILKGVSGRVIIYVIKLITFTVIFFYLYFYLLEQK